MSEAISQHVFLDAEVFVRFGFKYSSAPFKALTDLISKDRLNLVITDVVVREVDAQIEKAVCAAWAKHKRFLKDAQVLRSSTLEEIASKLEKFDKDAVIGNLKDNFRKFLTDNNARIVPTNEVALDDVMDDYFAGIPPFDTDNKKAEFPDAITVKALSDWADSTGAQVLVVSGDKGVCEACKPVASLIDNESVPAMLDNVSNDDRRLAEFIRTQVQDSREEIAAHVIIEFEDRYFFVLDENGDADVTVRNATLSDVDILNVKGNEATVEVLYVIEYEAEVTYDDPDMVHYDSETRESVSWGTIDATVRRDTYARADVGVVFEGLEPDQFRVNYITVTEPNDSFGVPLYDPRDDK